MKKSALFSLLLFLILASCNSQETPNNPTPVTPTTPMVSDDFIRGADLSFLTEVEENGIKFLDKNGVMSDELSIFKANGCNYVRVKLWHTPANAHNGLAEVVAFSQRIRAKGLKVWLDIHYSDDWADPGKQAKPAKWAPLSTTALNDSVAAYTKQVLAAVNPDLVQIGNEINNGFMWSTGNISRPNDFILLLKTGIKAARDFNPKMKIMVHFAGYDKADWFFDLLKTNGVDYDMIGLSYYPKWHGSNLDSLKLTINNLASKHNKDVNIAELSYPFTFGYNDYTNNIIGSLDQILPAFPPTEQGQKDYLLAMKKLIKDCPRGNGFCYWGADFIAFKGKTASNGSNWENQALFDFNNKELPAMAVFAQ